MNNKICSKQHIRNHSTARLNTLSCQEKFHASTMICKAILTTLVWKAAKCIIAFIPLASEPNILSLLNIAQRQKKKVFIPAPDKIPLRVTCYNSSYHSNAIYANSFSKESSLCFYMHYGCCSHIRHPFRIFSSYNTSYNTQKYQKVSQELSITILQNTVLQGNLGSLYPILILVPGRAFNVYGQRIGRGAGFYDVFCNMIKIKKYTMGICFDCQIMQETFPQNTWDCTMDFCMSENRNMEFSSFL